MDFAEGSSELRELLGGKGANIAEMTRVLGAERVPSGFTITTEAAVAYMRERQVPGGLLEEVQAALERLQAPPGRPPRDPVDPPPPSARSAAPEPMPGVVATVPDR